MRPQLDEAGLHDALAGGAMAVTGSARLARELSQTYAAFRLAHGERVWETPRIQPLDLWVQDGLRRIDPAFHRRTPGPEAWAALWEQAVAADEDPRLDVRNLARRAARTHATLAAYRIAEDELQASGSEACRRFLSWRERVLRALGQHGWCDPETRHDRLREHASVFAGSGSRLLLCGLETLEPREHELIDALEQAGCEVAERLPSTEAARIGRTTLGDPAGELLTAVRWAASRLQRQPDDRVAIVVPDLAERGDEVERVLERVIAPARTLPGSHGAPPWNISLGRPLSGSPPVADALAALAYLAGDHGFRILSRVLRSQRFELDGADRGSRCELLWELRRIGHPAPDLGLLAHVAGKRSPEVASVVSRLQERLARLPRRAPPSTWVEPLQGMLADLGWWSGTEVARAPDHQARERFVRCLADLAQLDTVMGEIGLASVVARVARSARDRLFQASTPPARLHVLGRLELAGLRFDAVWITGMDDGSWPSVGDPDPFLPRRLQANLGLPGSSPEQDLAFAQRVTRGLCRTGDEIVFSHAALGEEGDRRASPLIAEVAEIDPGSLELAPDQDHAARCAASLETERFEASRGSPLPHTATVSGGTGAVQDQSLCPFRGYAGSRLQLAAAEEPDAGLTAMDRGSHLHAVMEGIWRSLGGHRQLLELDAAAREQLVHEVSRRVYRRAAKHRPDLEAVLEVERVRVTGLALDLLTLEEERPSFETVGIERAETVDLGGVRIRMKLDRVDRLEDGRHVVLDYKSGSVTRSEWYGWRPRAPQLPLYALRMMPDVAAVAFVEMHAGANGFRGVAAEDGLLPGVSAFPGGSRSHDAPDLPGQLQHWVARLTALGEEIADGVCHVAPQPQACRYCDLGRLCRIAELDEDVGSDDD